MESLVKEIQRNYLKTIDRIAIAARSAGRSPESIKLVVVTKAQPLEVVQAAYQAGARIFGENYPNESVSKILGLASQSGVEWHMIGHVQSRKAQLVIEHFDLLHSLDSTRLAERLNRTAAQTGRILPVLLELNVGGEASKFGWPAADEMQQQALFPEVDGILRLSNLKINGLMTMPPLETNPEQARQYFQHLRNLRDRLAQRFPGVDWSELSMGTSMDFEVAVQEGASLVRVGTAILGSRPGYLGA